MKITKHRDNTYSIHVDSEEYRKLYRGLVAEQYENDRSASKKPYWWRDNDGDHKAWFAKIAADFGALAKQLQERFHYSLY